MSRRILILLLIVVGLFLRTPNVWAQQEEAEAARQEELRRQQQEEADRRREEAQISRDREESQRRLSDMLNDMTRTDPLRAPGAAQRRWDIERRSKLIAFQRAVPEFRRATRELLTAVGEKDQLKKTARVLEKSSNDILQFVKFINNSHPRFDSSEFKDFKPSELAWEALRTAEDISPYFEIIIRAEQDTSTVSIAFLDFLYKLESELNRLKWMASQLD